MTKDAVVSAVRLALSSAGKYRAYREKPRTRRGNITSKSAGRDTVHFAGEIEVREGERTMPLNVSLITTT